MASRWHFTLTTTRCAILWSQNNARRVPLRCRPTEALAASSNPRYADERQTPGCLAYGWRVYWAEHQQSVESLPGITRRLTSAPGESHNLSIRRFLHSENSQLSAQNLPLPHRRGGGRCVRTQ